MQTQAPVIVVGIDSSPRAQSVLDATRLMAERMNAKVVIVAAVEGMEWRALVPEELAAWNDSSLWAEMESSARIAVAMAAKQFPAGVVLDTKIEVATPWRLLVNEAKRRGAALIILGAHGYRPVERMLGTTASKVSNRAECSVLVIRHASDRATPLGFERIAVAHDTSSRAKAVLAAAVSLARPGHGQLLLIRGVTPPTEVTKEMLDKRPDELMALLETNAKATLEATRKTLPEGISAEAMTRVGVPSEVVTDIAREKNATLLVIGSHGVEGLDYILGTTAGRIVNTADRSVLIVRGDTFA